MTKTRLPRLLSVFLGFSVLAFLLSEATGLYFGMHHRNFPYSPALLPANLYLADSASFKGRFAAFHTPLFFGRFAQPFNYPAPVAVLFELFYGFLPHPSFTLQVLGAVLLFAAATFVSRAFIARGVDGWVAAGFTFTLLAVSYPIEIAVYLGQMEIAVWTVVAFGIWAFVTKKYYVAALCFGLGASFKYYPIILLGLFISEKRWKEIAAGVLTTVVVMLASLKIIGPSISGAYRGLSGQMAQFTQFYLYDSHPITRSIDHSLFSVIKNYFSDTHQSYRTQHAILIYLGIVATVGIILFFTRIVRLPTANQILALLTAMALLPPISHDYTLIHLYAPFVMLCFIAIKMRHVTGHLVAIFGCFLILFSNQNWLISGDHRLGGVLKMITLVVLFGLAMVKGIYPEET